MANMASFLLLSSRIGLMVATMTIKEEAARLIVEPSPLTPDSREDMPIADPLP